MFVAIAHVPGAKCPGVFRFGRHVHDGRLGSGECKPLTTRRWVKAEDHNWGRLPLQSMCPSVNESRRSRIQSVNGLFSEEDGVTGGLGQLLDAGSHVGRVRR